MRLDILCSQNSFTPLIAKKGHDLSSLKPYQRVLESLSKAQKLSTINGRLCTFCFSQMKLFRCDGTVKDEGGRLGAVPTETIDVRSLG